MDAAKKGGKSEVDKCGGIERRLLRMNELLELIKAFNADKNVYVTINYNELFDAYEIYMDEYDYEQSTRHRVKNVIRVFDLLSAKLPTHEVFVKLLNNMYEELKRGEKDEREARDAGKGETYG